MTTDSDTPYADGEGWASTGVYRDRINPNYSILNCLWTPKFIVQEQFIKVHPDRSHKRAYTLLTKWVSTNPKIQITDTPDTV